MSIDFWKRDLSKAEKLLDSIKKEVYKSPSYHKALTGNVWKSARSLRWISQLSSLLVYMQQGLSLTAGSDAFQGNALGSQDRASMVAQVSQELKKVESRFYTAITSSDMKEVDSPQDSDTTRDEESVQAQEQSNQLDYILGTAVSLKEIGYEINEEIGVHCRLLEEIEDREDQIFAKHRSNERLFQDWMKTKGSSLTFLWGLVIFLFITFIYVLLR